MYLTRIVSNKFNIIVSQYWICIVSVLHKRKKITHLLAGVNYHLRSKHRKMKLPNPLMCNLIVFMPK